MSDSTLQHDLHQIANAAPNEDGFIECPLIVLPNVTIFPNIVSTPLLTDRQALAAAEAAQREQRTAIVIATRDPSEGDAQSLYSIGTEVAVGRIMRTQEDARGALVQGRRRVQVVQIIQHEPYPLARARILADHGRSTNKVRALMQTALDMFQRLVEIKETIPEDLVLYALNTTSASALADLLLSTLTLPFAERQQALETLDVERRLRRVLDLMSEQLSLAELEDEIAEQLQQEMDRAQRDAYLREQVRLIQAELGEEDLFQQELSEVRQQIEAAELPKEVHDKAMKEFRRLTIMTPMAPEVGMVRTYIDWLTSIPWSKHTVDQLDLRRAQAVLDSAHYGLPKIKDRILEYLAVKKLAPETTPSPILCFVGPPGVGKTSLGKSIAAALGREFVRVSLGGVRDEAEIRGHRRTYIGALPGRIIQTMRRAGTVNPVFMLDEIDKLGTDFRGDPSSALLEILDPEQNYAFSDHYLEVAYDLSKVMFITTANDIDPLPPALLDRLEVIEFSGYTEEEKIAIAERFLIPKQMADNGLSDHPLHFEKNALKAIIREYTYEAGVRNLSREIANVSRKVARLVAEDKRHPRQISAKQVYRFLGPAPFDDLHANHEDSIGVATGLAWTPFGGDVLTIEASLLPGKGTLLMTGSLGEVMQESAQAALSYLRARADDFQLQSDDFETCDVHVHLPEGGVPKDGPSAGITLAIAIISAFTDRQVRSAYAMTGELTLRGKVLPVGGVKEKVLAARRARIKQIILPSQNQRDLTDIPRLALDDLQIAFVDEMQQVIDLVLGEPPASERKVDRIRRERDDKDKQDED